MKIYSYQISFDQLKPYVQHIIFHQNIGTSSTKQIVTSYPNINICFGLIKNHSLFPGYNALNYGPISNVVGSYLTGLYSEPMRLNVDRKIDEICIDFCPAGYFKFFDIPLRTYLLGHDVLYDSFGPEGKTFFEGIFEVSNLQTRGQLIEKFLESRLSKRNSNYLLTDCLKLIEKSDGQVYVSTISEKLGVSERTIHRIFREHLDTSPKNVIDITRFRRILRELLKVKKFTSIVYDLNFYDQSHMNKLFKKFTGTSLSSFVTLKKFGNQKDVIITAEDV